VIYTHRATTNTTWSQYDVIQETCHDVTSYSCWYWRRLEKTLPNKQTHNCRSNRHHLVGSGIYRWNAYLYLPQSFPNSTIHRHSLQTMSLYFLRHRSSLNKLIISSWCRTLVSLPAWCWVSIFQTRLTAKSCLRWTHWILLTTNITINICYYRTKMRGQKLKYDIR